MLSSHSVEKTLYGKKHALRVSHTIAAAARGSCGHGFSFADRKKQKSKDYLSSSVFALFFCLLFCTFIQYHYSDYLSITFLKKVFMIYFFSSFHFLCIFKSFSLYFRAFLSSPSFSISIFLYFCSLYWTFDAKKESNHRCIFSFFQW